MLASFIVIHLASFQLRHFLRSTVSQHHRDPPEYCQVTFLLPCESLVVLLCSTKQLFQRRSRCFRVENGVGNNRIGPQIYLRIKGIFATGILSPPFFLPFLLLLSFHHLTESEPYRACKLSLSSGSMADSSCLDFKYLR